MTQRRQFPRPVVRGRARLHPDQTAREFSKERQHFRSTQLLAYRDCPGVIDAVDLEDALGEVEADRGSLHGERFLFCGRINNDHPMARSTPDTGAVHPITLIGLAGLAPPQSLDQAATVASTCGLR